MPLIIRIFPFVAALEARQMSWFNSLTYASAALWIMGFAIMNIVPLTGDEAFYNGAAKAIASAVIGRMSTEGAIAHIVGYGWFMPGVPVILSPLYLIFSQPPLLLIRFTAWSLNVLLWIWMIREFHSVFGRKHSLALLIFPSLSLTWHFFTATIWADLPAGMLMAIAFARTYVLALKLLAAERPTWKSVVQLELLLIAMIYLRGSTLLIALGIHIFLIATAILSGKQTNFLLNTGRLISGLVLLCTLLAPWSILASKTLGNTVVTTSTVKLSTGITFGDNQKVCFGPCPEGNIWLQSVKFARDQAKLRNVDEITIQAEMADFALQGLTYAQYTEQTKKNFISFLFSPQGFNSRFFSFYKTIDATVKKYVETTFIYYNNVLYYPFLLAFLAMNIVPSSKVPRHAVENLLFKMVSVSFLVQPFFHPSHGRYWVGFAPLFGMAAASLWVSWTARKEVQRVDDTPNKQSANPFSIQILRLLQVLYAIFFVGVATAIVLA